VPEATVPSATAAILRLVRSGEATSRSQVARALGISPTTAAARIDALMTRGVLRDAGTGESHGGRRPQRIELVPQPGCVGVADLGARHALLAIFDMTGTLTADRHYALEITDGPERALAWLVGRLREQAGGQPLRGIALAVPGPVDFNSGRIVSPSRMPGWNGVDVAGLLARLSGVPSLVDNDANLMALGEFGTVPGTVRHLVFVKVGSGIGSGIIAAGQLHRGAHGMAGDISHVTVPDAEEVLCSCGRYGCLDAVASGAAIVEGLRSAGVELADTEELLQFAQDAHPLATRMLREAGIRTGNVLATIVNFFNPDAVVLGGNLSRSEAFVAGIRSAIYTMCLPMATDHLDIAVSAAGRLGGVQGAARLILDHLFERELIPAAENVS
jgi:predicted NBD/HSP70 family sugar kinase